MVVLNLATPNWDEFGPEYYVSVRVGESQKISRLQAARSFDFPKFAGGARSYGKIEIFKRMATAAVRLDKSHSSEVNLNVDGKVLNLDVQLDAPQINNGDNRIGRHEIKAKSAKEYLERHSLEMHLSEAVEAVLWERPDDPRAFICKRLAEAEVLVAKLARPVTAPAEQSFARMDVKDNEVAPQDESKQMFASKADDAARGDTPNSLKAGDTVRNIKSGAKGSVITRNRTHVLLKNDEGVEEWHNIEDFEKKHATLVMTNQARVGPGFMSIGLPNMVHLL